MAAAKLKIDLQELRRLALWGAAAVGAVTLTVIAVLNSSGPSRHAQVASQATPAAKPAAPELPPAFDAKQGERLAETVRTLTADRDRLLARIASLEQNLEDVTGSIARVQAQPNTQAEPNNQAPPSATPVVAAPDSEPSPPPSAAAIPQAEELAAVAVVAAIPAPTPVVPPAPAATAQPVPSASEAPAHAEFGIDIGRAATVEGLRALWTAVRSRHASQLEGLRPIVYLREGDRRGRVELRLLAGPIGSAAAAARLCATMTAAGTACRPAAWDGQRLALR